MTQQLFFFVILEPLKVIIKGCSIEVGVGSNTDPAPSIPCWVITSLPNSDFRRNTAGVWLEIAGFYTLISLMTNEAGKIRHKTWATTTNPCYWTSIARYLGDGSSYDPENLQYYTFPSSWYVKWSMNLFFCSLVNPI